MMEYTKGLMRELENLEIFEKTDSLTEIGKKRIVALRKCRDDFKKLHLPDVSESALKTKILSVLNDIEKMDNDGEWYGFMSENGAMITKLWNYCR